MAIELGTVTLYGLIVLMINGVALWIREWRKHRTWSANGDDLKEIKDDVKITNGKIDCLDGKVGDTKIEVVKIKTAVEGQAKHCKQTVNRFDKAIGDQNQAIINLAGRKR